MAFCTECGANVPDDLKFCTGCGKAMAPSASSQSPVQAAQTPPIQVTQASPVYTPPVNVPQQPVFMGNERPPRGSRYAVVGTMNFLGSFLLLFIPVVGLIIAIVWAIGSGNQNKRNFARAYLILMVIGIALGILLYFVISSLVGSFFGYIEGLLGESFGDLGNLGDLGGLNDVLDGLSSMPIN